MLTTILIAAGCALAGWLIPKGVAALRKVPDPDIKIPGHPKIAEALDALLAFGLHILQARMTEEALEGLVTLAAQKASPKTLGKYAVDQLGKPILSDTIAGAGQLLGTELSIVFGGQEATERAALDRLGLAAQHITQVPKVITTLPSGAKLVAPAK